LERIGRPALAALHDDARDVLRYLGLPGERTRIEASPS
jgi:hypothetical protein